MKLYIAMLATLVAVTGCKKDDDTGAADDAAGGGSDDGGGDGGTDTCEVEGTTCEVFADAYASCDGYDEAYHATLTDGTYDDAGCAGTYATWVAQGCCG